LKVTQKEICSSIKPFNTVDPPFFKGFQLKRYVINLLIKLYSKTRREKRY